MTQPERTPPERNRWVDFAKGAALFLVLWGHCIQFLSVEGYDFLQDRAFTVIYSFHMPFLMFLSGYVFYVSCRRHRFGELVRRRLRSLGVPLAVWGLVWTTVTLLRRPAAGRAPFLRTLLSCLSESWLWFLWAVLLFSVWVCAAHTLCRAPGAKYLWCAAGLLPLWALPGRRMTLFVYPYFVLGYAFCEFGLEEKPLYRRLRPLFLAGWLLMLPFYRKKHYIYASGIALFGSRYGVWGQLKIDLFRSAIGLLGTLAVLGLLRSLHRRLAGSPPAARLEQWGRRSLELYLFQWLLLENLLGGLCGTGPGKAAAAALTQHPALLDLLAAPALALAACVLLSAAAAALHRHRRLCAVLFGRG